MARTKTVESRPFAVAVSVLAVLAVQEARAVDISYGADATVGYSDNVAKVDGTRSGGSATNLGAGIAISELTSRLEADIAARGKYEKFHDGGFGSGFVAQLEADATLQLVQDRLSWTLEDSYGQAPKNQLAPDTPNNRQNLNYLNTGPNINFELGSRTEVIGEGRFSDLHFMGQDVGNRKVAGSLEIRRALSPSSGVSVKATSERLKWDSALGLDAVDRAEYFLRYEADGARSALWIDVGGRSVKQGPDSSNGLLARAELTRRITPTSEVRLQVGRENKDAGALFTQLQSDNAAIQDIDPVQLVPDSFESDYATLLWRATGVRTKIELEAQYYGERYRNRTEFDRSRYEGKLEISRDLNQRVTIGVSASYAVQDFTEQQRRFEDAKFGVTAEWQFGPRAFLTLNGQRVNRAAGFGFAGYSENQVWLQVALQGGSTRAGAGLQTRGTSPFAP